MEQAGLEAVWVGVGAGVDVLEEWWEERMVGTGGG